MRTIKDIVLTESEQDYAEERIAIMTVDSGLTEEQALEEIYKIIKKQRGKND